jgi:transcriptional regulator with XRE-family HTH domain
MAKITTRPYSHYAKQAATLLGQKIRKARIDRHMKAEELAGRAAISRGLLRRIENGDLGCTLGAVFEIAAIVGVQLFEADETTMTGALDLNTTTMALIPKSVRSPRVTPDDNF